MCIRVQQPCTQTCEKKLGIMLVFAMLILIRLALRGKDAENMSSVIN